MADTPGIRRTIIRSFKFNGLNINKDACDYLVSQLHPIDVGEQEEWLSKIIEFLQKKDTLLDPVIQKDHVVSAVEECCKLEVCSTDDITTVINVYNAPRFTYNYDSKKFLPISGSNKLLEDADSRILMFKTRYTIIRQRIARHELLTSNPGAEVERSNFKLSEIERLESCSTRTIKAVVYGFISQLKEGKYFLEDPTGILQLDLSETVYHSGLICENCLVLAEGVYSDGIFHVHGLALPPAETSNISRNYFGKEDTFGQSNCSMKYSTRLLKIEKENQEAMIVFIADIWLDDIQVQEKLRLLFSGYNDHAPVLFVLMGNFLSKPHGGQHAYILREKLKELGEMIKNYEQLLLETTFVIVPGPTDSPFANILPRPPLPSFITEEFSKCVPRSIFTTNPTRIQYCTQEICIFREDILTKMCRNCIKFPESGDISLHFVKTIISQCYLVPVALSVCPVYWNQVWAMTLYPLPDVLVIADQRSPFNFTHKECIVFNPSSFSLRQYSFKVYIPASKSVEDSQIVDERDTFEQP